LPPGQEDNVMAQTEWRPVGRVDRSVLSQARLQAHHAAQWLARAARAYVAARPDDAHTNLGWGARFGGLMTHAMRDGNRLGLQIGTLTLALAEDGAGSASEEFSLDGHTDRDVRSWLGSLITARGFDAAALDAPSPYEIPAHPIATGAAYAAAPLRDALTELANWYANANDALGAARTRLNARGLNAPEVRCWPHHFDLDTLLAVTGDKPEDYRSTGLGFSPGDEYYDEPYFYVSVYPAPAPATLPPLPVGHWHTHHFTAAVATAGHLVAAAAPGREVEIFLNDATTFSTKALG
jgi:hypothetical protein